MLTFKRWETGSCESAYECSYASMYERVRSCAKTATRSDTLAYQDDAEQAGIRFNLILGTSQLKCLVLTLQSRHFLALRTVKEALELRSCL